MKFIGGPHDGEMAPFELAELAGDREAICHFKFHCCAAEYRTLVGEDGFWFVRADRAVCQPISTDDVLNARRYFTDRPQATLRDLQ